MVNHLVFRWTKPVCSMVWGAHGIYMHLSQNSDSSALGAFLTNLAAQNKTTDRHQKCFAQLTQGIRQYIRH